MDFTENRFRGYCDRVLSGDILCETGNEDETCFQRHTGWYPDHASGTSPDSAGFILLLLFSLRRPFGAFLLDNFDIKIVQTWKGCVIAASVIAFPLMYRNARAAFEQVDVNLIAAGKTLGMSDRRIFWTVVMRQQDPESHPVQSLPLPEQSENTVLHPCSQETFLARPEPFPLPLLRRLRQEIMHGRFLGSCDLDHFICDRCGNQYRFR